MSSQEEIDALNALVELNEAVQEQNFSKMGQFFDHLFAVYAANFKNEVRPEEVESTYSGVHLSKNYEVNDFLKMVESFRNNQKLHAKYALQILEDSIKVLQNFPNVTSLNSSQNDLGIIVVGDLHGSFKDLSYIISKYGIPGVNYSFVFNGDFVDRGPQQSEVLLTLLYSFLMNPNKVCLNRGNHEDLSINLSPNFNPNFKKDTELKFGKYSLAVFNQAQRLFRRLPLATIVQNNYGLRYFVAHGGLSDRIDLNFILSQDFNRFQFANIYINKRDPPNVIRMAEQLNDLLWSDPTSSSNGCRPNNHRGAGYLFGPDVSENFCRKYGFNGIIRSHEVRDQGLTRDHTYCYTVFSSSRYCGGSNKAAVIIIETNGDNIKYKSFDTAPFSTDQYIEEKNSLIRGLKSCLKKGARELYDSFSQNDTFKNGQLNIQIWAKIITDHLYSKFGVKIDPRHIITLKDYLCPCNDANYTAEYSSMFGNKDINQTSNQQLEFLKTLFNLIDTNSSGTINHLEAENAINLINRNFGTNYSSSFMRNMDSNRDGRIDLNEFYNSFKNTFNF